MNNPIRWKITYWKIKNDYAMIFQNFGKLIFFYLQEYIIDKWIGESGLKLYSHAELVSASAESL